MNKKDPFLYFRKSLTILKITFIMIGLVMSSLTHAKLQLKNKNIILTDKTDIINSNQQQQTKRTITGVVTDSKNGETLIGVNILIKGTNQGVITDFDGNYSIQVSGTKTILQFSYIGFETREIAVENLGIIDVKMKADDTTLDEVVVIGAGTQKKVSVTGAITSRKGESLRLPT